MSGDFVADRGSSVRILDLYPDVGNCAALLMESVMEQAGRPIRLTEGFRSYVYQNALYAKGRTAPGVIVTWAKGGQSYHNFGVAFDVCFAGPDPYLERDPEKNRLWNLVVELGLELGLSAGANFPIGKKDLPHFEKTYGFSEFQMDTITRSGGIRLLWEKFDETLGISNALWETMKLPDPMIPVEGDQS